MSTSSSSGVCVDRRTVSSLRDPVRVDGHQTNLRAAQTFQIRQKCFPKHYIYVYQTEHHRLQQTQSQKSSDIVIYILSYFGSLISSYWYEQKNSFTLRTSALWLPNASKTAGKKDDNCSISSSCESLLTSCTQEPMKLFQRDLMIISISNFELTLPWKNTVK